MDPTDERDKELYEKNKKEVENELKRNRQLKHNKSRFKPYDVKEFRDGGKDFKIRTKTKVHFVNIILFSNQQKVVSFGKETATPTPSEMKKLDPVTWKDNVNFVPIPPSKNKMLKLKM